MKKNITIALLLVLTLLIGITIGRFISPVKETLIENEIEKIVEVKSPTAGLAKKYLSKFIDTQEQVNNLPHNEQEYQTTIGMRELASQEYEMWDTLLNEVYSELKNILSTEDMDNLTNLQIQWISDRDTIAETAGKKAEGGTLQPLLITTSKSQTTKERCLELINDYMN